MEPHREKRWGSFFVAVNFSLSGCWRGHKINGVIPNQSADWCGDPVVTRRKLPQTHRFVVLINRGIATPVCGLVRNDIFLLVR